MDGLEFESSEAEVPPGGRVFVYSDGAFEISRPDGSMWPFEEFVATLTAPAKGSESPIDTLVTKVRSVAQQDDFHDDFSMLELVFS